MKVADTLSEESFAHMKTVDEGATFDASSAYDTARAQMLVKASEPYFSHIEQNPEWWAHFGDECPMGMLTFFSGGTLCTVRRATAGPFERACNCDLQAVFLRAGGEGESDSSGPLDQQRKSVPPNVLLHAALHVLQAGVADQVQRRGDRQTSGGEK
jgi:hypothetical protein